MAPTRRTAALVISAFVEPHGNPPWYTRVAFYEDAFSPAIQAPPQATIDGVCGVVREWLESVVVRANAEGDDTSVTAS